MTKVEVGFSKEDLQFDIVGEDAEMPHMSQLADKDDSKLEIMCMDTTQTDIISGLENSSGPIRFSMSKDNRWKPYSEREKQRLEEQNTRRAILVQKELLRRSLSFSPFYVPHFDDHRSDVDEIEQTISSHHREISCRTAEKIATGTRHREISSSSEECSPKDDDEFTTRVSFDFSSKADDSRYMGLSNQDLVKEFMETEDKLDELGKALKAAKLHNQLSKRTFNIEAELEKIRVFRKEIEKLTQENNHLLCENQKLHSILRDAD